MCSSVEKTQRYKPSVLHHRKDLTNAQFLILNYYPKTPVAPCGCCPSDKNWEFRNWALVRSLLSTEPQRRPCVCALVSLYFCGRRRS